MQLKSYNLERTREAAEASLELIGAIALRAKAVGWENAAGEQAAALQAYIRAWDEWQKKRPR